MKISQEERKVIEHISQGFSLVILKELMLQSDIPFNPVVILTPLADTFANTIISLEQTLGKQNMLIFFDLFEKIVRVLYCQKRKEK